MEQLKNTIVILASIAIIAFIADQLGTKYNIDTTEATCISDDVEFTFLALVTEGVKKDFEEQGYTLISKVLKENTLTKKRDITYKGHSKYSCSTTVEFTLDAVLGNKKTEEIIKLISKENLIATEDSDYKITTNDMGTTYFIQALPLSEDNIGIFSSEITQASNKIKQINEDKCSKIYKAIIDMPSEKQPYKEMITNIQKNISRYDKLYKECMGTSFEIPKTAYTNKIENLQKEIETLEKKDPLSLEKVCDGGDADKCNILGDMYITGQGVKQDGAKAIELWVKSCTYGNNIGCNNLGYLYKNGQAVEQNYSKAMKYYTKTCDNNDAKGCFNLGLMYDRGNGVKKNNSKAKELWRKACDNGSSDGCQFYENTFSKPTAQALAPVNTSTNMDNDLVIMNGEEDGDTVEVLIKGNDEMCGFHMDSTGGLSWTNCLEITNSQKVKILCTEKKTICKTVNELRKAIGVSGY